MANLEVKKGSSSVLDELFSTGKLHVNDNKVVVVINSVEKSNGLIVDPSFQSHEGTVVAAGDGLPYQIGDRVWWTKAAFVQQLPLGPKESYFVIVPSDIVFYMPADDVQGEI